MNELKSLGIRDPVGRGAPYVRMSGAMKEKKKRKRKRNPTTVLTTTIY